MYVSFTLDEHQLNDAGGFIQAETDNFTVGTGLSDDTEVQGTNDFSTVSKCSMVQHKYFDDEYISEFIPQCSRSRRAPLINIGYFVRAVAVHHTLCSFLTFTKGLAAQIVSCGAGFDSNYFRLRSKGVLHSGIVYYEVDFPEVVQRKTACIQHSKLLLDTIGTIVDPGPTIMGPSYRLVAGNLSELAATEQALRDAGLDFTLPTLLLAECSITYMDEARSSELISWAASMFQDATFVTYEQVYPHDGFGVVMQRHFQSLGSPLLSLQVYPDLEAQEQRYTARKWTSCTAVSAFDVFMQVTERAERLRVLSLEPFDEFEEWHLKCCHYTLTVALKGSFHSWTERCKTYFHPASPRPEVKWALLDGGDVSRFCHRSVYIPSDSNHTRTGCILVVGGFGCSTKVKSRHGRVGEVGLLNCSFSVNGDSNISLACLPEVTDSCEGVALNCMYHTCTRLSDVGTTSRVLLHGGRSSPRNAVNAQPALLSMKKFKTESMPCVAVNTLTVVKQQQEGPAPRWRHSAVRIHTSSKDQDQVFVFGGRTSEMKVLGDLWCLTICDDESSVKFREVKHDRIDPWPCPRFSHSAAQYDAGTAGMIVTGGLGGWNFQPLADLWLFCATTETWQELMLQGPDMLPRYGHTSVMYQDRLVLLGGVNTLAGAQPGVAVIHLANHTCVEYALPAQDPERPILLHNHSSEQVDGGSMVLVVGGGGNCFSFGTAFNKCLVLIDLQQFVQEDL